MNLLGKLRAIDAPINVELPEMPYKEETIEDLGVPGSHYQRRSYSFVLENTSSWVTIKDLSCEIAAVKSLQDDPIVDQKNILRPDIKLRFEDLGNTAQANIIPHSRHRLLFLNWGYKPLSPHEIVVPIANYAWMPETKREEIIIRVVSRNFAPMYFSCTISMPTHNEFHVSGFRRRTLRRG